MNAYILVAEVARQRANAHLVEVQASLGRRSMRRPRGASRKASSAAAASRGLRLLDFFDGGSVQSWPLSWFQMEAEKDVHPRHHRRP